jgi:acyl carrier protein
MMDNKKKYQETFIKSLAINKDQFSENLKYNEIPEWDSIGHMTLMSGLEEEFSISLETDDIVDFSSYAKGIIILKKYNISF